MSEETEDGHQAAGAAKEGQKQLLRTSAVVLAGLHVETAVLRNYVLRSSQSTVHALAVCVAQVGRISEEPAGIARWVVVWAHEVKGRATFQATALHCT